MKEPNMISLPEMGPVSAKKRCPICKKPDWCLIAPDGSAAICQRTESAKRCGEAGWLHHLQVPEPRATGNAKPSTPSVGSKLGNWQTEAERFADKLAGLPASREALAERLVLPATALDAIPLLGIRNYTPGTLAEFTIPETDAEGKITGIATRTEAMDKKVGKRFLAGGKRGLTLPAGSRERAGAAFIVEGPTDFLAMTAAGLLAVGRPSCSGGGKHLSVFFAEWVGEIHIVGENDRKPNDDWPGRDGARSLAKILAEKLGRPVKWTLPPDDVKDVREWLTAEARGDTLWPQRGEELAALLMSNATPVKLPVKSGDSSSTQARRKIIVDTEEFRVNSEAAAALAEESELYSRGGQLVAVVEQREDSPAEALIRRPHGVALVRPLTPASLRERLSRCAQFINRKVTDDGIVERSEHPPAWCINAVFDRGLWPVPHLEAIVTHPTFLPNGTLLTATGYNPASRLFLSLEANLKIDVAENPTRADVVRAVETLEDVLYDFPFQTPAHKAGWFAGLLTPLTWFAFDGPAPFFLIDANVRGAGKGLMADVIAIILFGRRFSTMAYTNDCEELRKKITSLAVASERAVMLDNLEGKVGNAVFDSADVRILEGSTSRRELGLRRPAKRDLVRNR